MSRIKSLLLVCAALFVVYVPLASSTVTYAVGACGLTGITSYSSITLALAAIPAPDVIKVCPGTHREQVVITTPVTLEGVSSEGEGQAVIAVPSGGLALNTVYNGPVANNGPAAAQIFVDNASGPVNITNITVDGDGNGVSGFPALAVIGVFYLNSSGTLFQIEARYQTGTGQGIGVLLQNGSIDESVTVENSNMHDFDLDGIVLGSDTGTLTATVKDNTVIVESTAYEGLFLSGPVSFTASGNFIDGGAFGIDTYSPGSISGNTITNSGKGTGIVIEPGTQVSVTSNKIYDTQTGISLFGPVSVQSNIITQAYNAIDFNCQVDNSVSSNTISVIHNDGLAHVPGAVTSTNTYYNVHTISGGGC